MNPMEARRHELLTEVYDLVMVMMSDHGVAEDITEQVACNIANLLAESWGGQLISFPQDYFFKLANRDLQIYNHFTGNNYSDLVKRYNMTESGIRKVINRTHKKVLSGIQPQLFDD